MKMRMRMSEERWKEGIGIEDENGIRDEMWMNEEKWKKKEV